MFSHEDTIPTPTAVPASRHRFPDLHIYASGGKRLLDTAIILAASPVLILLMIVIALLVMIDGGSPIYRQVRLGRGWSKFRIIKFRTMCHDSARELERHLATNPAACAEWDETQKLTRDPRVTRVGRFLRKTSLDELPQVFNVLAGSMSIVGPRPMVPEQRRLYPAPHYAAWRPGMTGLWQVSARSGHSFSVRVAYDERYNAQICLGVDLLIITRTFSAVAHCTGC